MAAKNGKGDWQSIAAANGIEDPLRLTPGRLVDLNARASIGLGRAAGRSDRRGHVGAGQRAERKSKRLAGWWRRAVRSAATDRGGRVAVVINEFEAVAEAPAPQAQSKNNAEGAEGGSKATVSAQDIAPALDDLAQERCRSWAH